MRKVIGIGETILDIIFREGQPTTAVPGGSVFNGLVSLARTGVPVSFVSETGQDSVGQLIVRFMRDNGLDTSHVYTFANGQSPVSLAFLDEHSDARYLFYKNYPAQRLDVDFPPLAADDIVVLGSYYALDPVLRDKVTELLEAARQAGALVYYDPNFRAAHRDEAIRLAPAIIENLEYADIVRGSQDDFFYMYGLREADRIYREKVKFYCPTFLCTDGARSVALRTASLSKDYPVAPLQAVSTIGAGDNFNAGIIYGLLTQGVRRDDLGTCPEATWDAVVQCGLDFAANVCRSFGNSVSADFAAAHPYREGTAE